MAPKPKTGMTTAEARCLIAIVKFWRKNHYAPSYRDLCKSLGYAGTNAVIPLVRGLSRKRFVEFTAGVSRSIVPLGKACPICGSSNASGL